MRMAWCVRARAVLLADGGGTVLPANPLQRGLLAPLRLCRRWQNPDRCPPGGDTREVGQGYELSGGTLLPRPGWGAREALALKLQSTSLQTFS